MAIAQLDIVNAALHKVGQRVITAIDDTTPSGVVAGDVFELERDSLLRAYNWNFAIARAQLSTLAQAPTFEFTYAFGVPSDWLKTISVHNHADASSSVRYKMETVSVTGTFTRAVLTDTAAIDLRYVRQVTDIALMCRSFIAALTHKLAKVFAVALGHSPALMQLHDKDYEAAVAEARINDEIEDYPEFLDSAHWGADILNAALRYVNVKISPDAAIALQPGVVAADLLEQERDALLREFRWNFAIHKADLSTVATAPAFEMTNAFGVPADWLKTLSVHDKTTPNINVKYRMETVDVSGTFTPIIATDAADVYLRYIRKVTSASLMTPSFKRVLSLRLARILAPASAAGANIITAVDADMQRELAAARASNEIENYPEFIDESHWAAEIVNAALRRVFIKVGNDQEMQVPAGIVVADLLEQERDALLRQFNWNFATTRADLTALGSAPTFEFSSAFGLPTDWIRTISVHDKADPTISIKYRLETVDVSGTQTAAICCSASDVYLRYVRKMSDASLMTPIFRQLLSLRLARVFASHIPDAVNALKLIEQDIATQTERAQNSDEVEDHPDFLNASHWGATIVSAALRKVSVRAAELEAMIPVGIVAADSLDQERDALLREHLWNFAVTRARLGRLNVTPEHGYSYAYGVPSDWLRTIAVTDNPSDAGQADYRQEAILTAELITNGKFDADATWTKGTGWTISGGVAPHASGSSSDLSQTIAPVTGGLYRVVYEVIGMSAGTITPKFTGGTTITGTAQSADGYYVEEFTALSGNNAFVLSASSDFDGQIDNVSVVRLDGAASHAIMADSEAVYLKYVRKVTAVSLMPASFRQILILRMAKIFAGVKPDATNWYQLLDGEMKTALRQARSIDGMEDYPDEFPEGSWNLSRYAGRDDRYSWASR